MKSLSFCLAIMLFQGVSAQQDPVPASEKFFFDRHFYIEDCFKTSGNFPCVSRPSQGRCINSPNTRNDHLVCGDSILLRRIPKGQGYDVVFSIDKIGHGHSIVLFGKLQDGDPADGIISLKFLDDYPPGNSVERILTLRAARVEGQPLDQDVCSRVLKDSGIPEPEIRSSLCGKNDVIHWRIKTPQEEEGDMIPRGPPDDGQGTGSGDGMGGG